MKDYYELAPPAPEAPEAEMDFGFKTAVFFLAGHYAAEEVRRHQQYAVNRGSTMSAQQIGDLFRGLATEMATKILKTSGAVP